VTQPIRVVHVAGSAEWGGGERYLELFARHLDRDRFALEVVLPAPGPLGARLEALGVAVHVVDLGALVSPAAAVGLAATLRRLAPDVVQSHGARSNVYTRLAGRLAGVPAVVSTVHNALRDYPVAPARLALYRAMDRLTRPLATRVVCVAAELARDHAGRAAVIHNGIDLDDFDARALLVAGRERRASLGLDAAPVMGFVGRLTPQKDPLTFLRVLAAVRRARPDVQGVVVGDGPLRADVGREAAALGVAARCRVVGERSDVPALLAAMDVVVLTSTSEGFPFVVLEAMAAERPVVATAVNGVPEIVEHGVTGWLAPRGDVDALARATLDVLTAPDAARRMGQASRERVAGRFTARRMVAETQALYLRLLPAARAVARARA
jgi:glycosyltransferase involved in cell wall biosynthesis